MIWLEPAWLHDRVDAVNDIINARNFGLQIKLEELPRRRTAFGSRAVSNIHISFLVYRFKFVIN